jgi:DNA-binding LacI/PurR family transcriptional regulator
MLKEARKVSIYHIAKEAAVSTATVSRVLNNRVGVGEATRTKINKLLRQYNFNSNYPAKKVPKIAVITPFFSCYTNKAISEIHLYAQQNGIMVSVMLTELPRKESLLELIRDQQCSGAIVLLPDYYKKELEGISNSDLPIMVIDSTSSNENIGFIENNSYSGTYEAVKYLLSLGHRKIGYLQYNLPTLNHLQRIKGYEHTMKAANLEIKPSWVVNAPKGLNSSEGGASAMEQLLAQAPEITAVIAADDYMALGAMKVIHETGLRIPEDISVVGFDNYPETEFWFPSLTTVDHPIGKAGYMAMEALHKSLQSPGKWTPLQEILPTSLVIRKSTGPAKK